MYKKVLGSLAIIIEDKEIVLFSASEDDAYTRKKRLDEILLNILNERDHLEASLERAKEDLCNLNEKLIKVEKERSFLSTQLGSICLTNPIALQQLLHDAHKKIKEFCEEIAYMKSERSNTELLLEHLEFLVSRHERSFRETVFKRHQNNVGVASEVEVLKALKSLFEHHKALDIKVRGKLKSALQREMHLEELLQTCVREKKMLQNQLEQFKQLDPIKEDAPSSVERSDSFKHRSITVDPKAAQIEFARLTKHADSALHRVTDLEKQLELANEDLKKSKEAKNQLENDCTELRQSRKEVKKKLELLENKYEDSQEDKTSLCEFNDRIGNEHALKLKTQIKPVLDLSENRSIYLMTHSDITEKLLSMESQLEEKSKALQLAHQKERLNDDYCQKLSATVEKLLIESNERLQLHLEEKMVTIKEKNNFRKELKEMKKLLENAQLEKEHWQLRADKLESEMSNHQLTKVLPSNDKEWRANSDNIFIPIRSAFEECSEMGDSVYSAADLEVTPDRNSQYLVNVLQEQLDNINQEIRVLQREKRTYVHPKGKIIIENSNVGERYSEVAFQLSNSDVCPGNSKSCSPHDEIDKPVEETNSIEDTILNASENEETSRVPFYARVSFMKKTLNRNPTKNRIKSSLGRLLGKREKIIPSNGATVDDALSFDSSDAIDDVPDVERKEKLLEQAIADKTPFTSWNVHTLLVWLELWVGLPAWYVSVCRANVKSGEIMSKLSDEEIHKELKISHPLHRLKLRLATREINSLTCQSNLKPFESSLATGSMNHTWIADEWLPSLGLSQYRSYFLECLIDGRMLEHLTKKNLRQNLKLLDSFHRSSLHFGIQCLKRLDYDRKELERRRNACFGQAEDLMVWSNQRVISWLESIGLQEFAGNLSGNGVHGAMLLLDDTYDTDALATSMLIPTQNTQARELLQQELSKLKNSKKARRSNYSKITPKLSSKWEMWDRPLPCLPADEQQSADTAVYDYPTRRYESEYDFARSASPG